MSLKSYFVPQTLQKFHSQYNTDIELVKFSGNFRLDMGGLTQSGWIIEEIWGSALKKLLPKDFIPQKVLILGLGAGSAAKLISRRYPQAAITGVEIDPVVIDIGKKYFHTEKITNLTIVEANAIDYVKKHSPHSFDLVLVDCYLGDQTPLELASPAFLKQLTALSPHVLINRLFWSHYQLQTSDWLDSLAADFTFTPHRTPSNLVIALREK